MKFSKFEEIEAWQLAREMCRLVKKLTEKEGFGQDWELKKQIKSAAGSAMDCIAEGYERGNKNEFVYFLGISKGSCGEVRSQGYRALDSGFISENERLSLDKLAWRTGAALQKLIEYLNTTPKGGQRFAKPERTKPTSNPNFPTEPPPYL
ncbi:MAG: four helix bundle protein [Saprospiraceae bacterium]|nr:four helix bundle protein [Saprospiraceae bacterium]